MISKSSSKGKNAPILELGCGNSPLSYELYKTCGYQKICVADFSEECIKNHKLYQSKTPSLSKCLSYKVEDAKKCHSRTRNLIL
eukprot:UN19796